MPVLVTISTVSALFLLGSKGSKNNASFLDPPGLRAKLEKLPKGPTREKALAIVDKLDVIAKEHDEATEAAIEAYVADVEKYTTTGDQLAKDLEPLDQARTRVYLELIELRESLANTLTAKEWKKVFGK